MQGSFFRPKIIDKSTFRSPTDNGYDYKSLRFSYIKESIVSHSAVIATDWEWNIHTNYQYD